MFCMGVNTESGDSHIIALFQYEATTTKEMSKSECVTRKVLLILRNLFDESELIAFLSLVDGISSDRSPEQVKINKLLLGELAKIVPYKCTRIGSPK